MLTSTEEGCDFWRRSRAEWIPGDLGTQPNGSSFIVISCEQLRQRLVVLLCGRAKTATVWSGEVWLNAAKRVRLEENCRQ